MIISAASLFKQSVQRKDLGFSLKMLFKTESSQMIKMGKMSNVMIKKTIQVGDLKKTYVCRVFLQYHVIKVLLIENCQKLVFSDLGSSRRDVIWCLTCDADVILVRNFMVSNV